MKKRDSLKELSKRLAKRKSKYSSGGNKESFKDKLDEMLGTYKAKEPKGDYLTGGYEKEPEMEKPKRKRRPVSIPTMEQVEKDFEQSLSKKKEEKEKDKSEDEKAKERLKKALKHLRREL